MKKIVIIIVSLLFAQITYAAQLKDTIINNDLTLDTGGKLSFEGATADDFEQIIGTIDPSADRNFNYPNDEMVAGDVLVASDAADLEYLNLTTTEILIGDGVGIPTAAALSGDVTMDNTGAVTIIDDIIVKANFADEDWGDASISSNNFTLDANVVSNDELATQGVSTDKLQASNKPTSGQVYSYNSTSLIGQWVASGGGSDTNSVKEYYWPASALLPLASGDNIAPISKDAGINRDLLTRLFDDTAGEAAAATFQVPSDVDTSGTVTFRLRFYATTPAANNVLWKIYHSPIADAEDWDAVVTEVSFDSFAAVNNQDDITVATETATITALSWSASDMIYLTVSRDPVASGDDLSGDAEMIDFSVEIPRA